MNEKKMILIVVLFLVFIALFTNITNASETISETFSDADDFLKKGESIDSKINQEQLRTTSNFIYKLLLAIGIVVMFIVGTILGIQFMTASAEDKAKVKESLIPYIVGCAVILGAFTIWSAVIEVMQGTF